MWITLWSKIVGKLWEISARVFILNMLCLNLTFSRHRLKMADISSPHIDLQPCAKPNLVCIPQKTYRRPSIPMASLVHRMRTGHGAANDPKNNQNLAGFIQAPRFHQTKEIRRASEQTSPQVARAVGLPRQGGTGGGLISGSRSTRRFYFHHRGNDLRRACVTGRDST